MSYQEFLQCLGSEERYQRLQAKLVFFFERNNCSDPIHWTGVTIDRVAAVFPVSEPIREIESWVFGFAKRVLHEAWRDQARVTSKNAETVISTEGSVESNTEVVNDEDPYERMRQCFRGLAAEDQQLMISYFTTPEGLKRAEHRTRMTETLGITVNALRIRINKV